MFRCTDCFVEYDDENKFVRYTTKNRSKELDPLYMCIYCYYKYKRNIVYGFCGASGHVSPKGSCLTRNKPRKKLDASGNEVHNSICWQCYHGDSRRCDVYSREDYPVICCESCCNPFCHKCFVNKAYEESLKNNRFLCRDCSFEEDYMNNSIVNNLTIE